MYALTKNMTLYSRSLLIVVPLSAFWAFLSFVMFLWWV